MAIKDLLWACPSCHRVEAIDTAGTCTACGTRFSRGRGARIRAVSPDGTEEQHPREWLAQLPWPDVDGEGRFLPAGLRPPFVQTATVRLATADVPLRRGGDFLGFVELFGESVEGRLELTDEVLSFTPATGTGWCWPLHEMTAISPASSAIQLKARGRRAASIRFPEGSLRLWEQRLLYCVRQAYDRAGQGEITEFQPHVRTR